MYRSQTLSVVYDPQKDSYNLLADPQDTAATARATYHTNVNYNGWNFFEAKALPVTSSHAAYLDSLRAMGYLEGYSSWQQIVHFYPNYYQSMHHIPCLLVYIRIRSVYIVYLTLYSIVCVCLSLLRHL
jgi:hypothetical protein